MKTPRSLIALTLGRPIVRVTHDEQGDLQFHALEGVADAEPRVVALSEMVELDGGLLELADLPPGWIATRPNVAAPWQRSPKG
jgi:hypothetical protein